MKEKKIIDTEMVSNEGETPVFEAVETEKPKTGKGCTIAASIIFPFQVISFFLQVIFTIITFNAILNSGGSSGGTASEQLSEALKLILEIFISILPFILFTVLTYTIGLVVLPLAITSLIKAKKAKPLPIIQIVCNVIFAIFGIISVVILVIR